MTDGKVLHGRRVIYTDYEEITAGNVVEVLNNSLYEHNSNRYDIQYLWDYYRGIQPILHREKKYNDYVLNKLVENRANEIVAFKVGYLMGEPIQYVSRNSDDTISQAINRLNEFTFAEDKAAKDKELADWFHICGTSYRMVLPDKDANVDDDESPFEIYTLDPRFSYVVYWTGLGNKPVMGVKFVETKENGVIFSVYTKDTYYEIVDNKIVKALPHTVGDVPIVEYPANVARLGAFEIVLPLLDAINEVASNRIDGVEQFIQSLLVLKGVDMNTEDFAALKEMGGIKVPPDGDVKYLFQELNQGSTQTLVDHMYETVLTICGMPNRNGGTSTSDTGTAVIFRDGFTAAEGRAKDSEMMFKKSEKQFLKMVLRIMDGLKGVSLKLSDIEIRFTRRNYENILMKAQVLTQMLGNEKIHPKLAFEHSGMFIDPEVAYAISEKYFEEERQRMEDELMNQSENEHKDDESDV